jgi:Fe-S oxidoreductase
MVQGDVITEGWRSSEVHDALDLCLACKGCRSDCPVDVDMATYKAEFLFHHYRRRLRPMAHYSMGWIPLWARLAAAMPGLLNTVTHTRGLSTLVKKAGGIDINREMPNFADERFTSWFRHRRSAATAAPHGRVILWPDTFVNNFDPEVGKAAVAVLESAGFAVEVPHRTVCCGLTWISTGQLKTAKRVLRRTLTTLRPALDTSSPVVVLEPSCAAVFRSDLPELLFGDEDAHRLAKQTYTLGELLAQKAPDWKPPHIDAEAVVQQHCHQHAILGHGDDRQLLVDAGVEPDVLDAGCCGLAGNFGFEKGHYDVSVACAEDKLMPALRNADADALVLADGFSCRTQIRELSDDRQPMHIAQVIAAALPGASRD